MSVRSLTQCVPTVNVLVVVGTERLSVEMNKLMNTNKTVTVIRVPKSDGVSPSLSHSSTLLNMITDTTCRCVTRLRTSTCRPCPGYKHFKRAPTSTAALP